MIKKKILARVTFALFFCFLPTSITWAEVSPREKGIQRLAELNQQAGKNTSSNPGKALEAAAEALKLADELQDWQGRSVALLNMGLAYLQQGKLPEVRRQLEESLRAAQQAGYLQGQGDAHNFLGTYFWEEGMFDQAQKNYTKALEIRTSLGDRIGMSKSINNLGLVQSKIGNFDKASEHFKRSLELKGADDATGRCNTLVNLAVVHLDMKNYDQALQVLEQARKVGEEARYIQGQAFAFRSMGDVQLERNFLPEALVNYSQALQLYEKADYAKGVAFSLYGRGQVYEKQGKSKLALENFLRALNIAEQIEQKKLMADIYYHTAHLAEANGETAEAFAFYEKNIQIERNIFMEETRRRIALQQISYDNEKQQQEIADLTLQTEQKAMESRNREKLLLISLISLVLLGFFAVNLRKQLLIKQKREQELLAVTQRLEQSQEKLKSSKIRYQALMEQSFEALALVDAKTQEIVEINHQFTKLFGYSLPEDAPLYVKQVVDVPQRELDIVLGDTLKRQGFLPPVSRTYSHKNGTEVPVERAVTAITLDGGEYLLSSMRDLTEEQRRQKALAVSLGELRIKQDLLEKTNALLVESQQALIHQATHDSLTGLLNRRAAMELLAKELVRNKRQGEGLAIGICDIDYFKKINDTWGHQTGDEVLRRLARILTADLREYDSVARIGGEEFLLIIPLKRERDAESIFERLRATIEQEKIITKDGEEIGITVSIGVSNATADSDMEKLLSEADVALYQAKGQGRNLVAYAGNT